MERITSVKELREAIRVLESKQAFEWAALKEQAHLTSESLQPANLVKRMVRNLVSSPPDTELLDKGIGVAAGYIAKKIITLGSHNPFTKIAGSLIENIVANKVSQNAAGIKSIGSFIMKKILGNSGDVNRDK